MTPQRLFRFQPLDPRGPGGHFFGRRGCGGLRERGNDTSRSTGRSGRQNAAMQREERVTVQGPVNPTECHTGRGVWGLGNGTRRPSPGAFQCRGCVPGVPANLRPPPPPPPHAPPLPPSPPCAPCARVLRVINVINLTENRVVRRYMGNRRYGVGVRPEGRKEGIKVQTQPQARRSELVKAPETFVMTELVDPPSSMDFMKIDDRDHVLLGLRNGNVQLYNISKQPNGNSDMLSTQQLPNSLVPVTKWNGCVAGPPGRSLRDEIFFFVKDRP